MIATSIAILLSLSLTTAAGPAEEDERLAWWREARFGLFFHWELSPSRTGTRRHRFEPEAQPLAPSVVASSTAPQIAMFDPEAFDASAWTRLAKKSGMRYLVATAKHVDGFCFYDSAHTEHDVMSTPFARDVIGELAAASREEGLRFGVSISVADGSRPDSLVDPDDPDAEERFTRYRKRLHAQVTELLSRYGTIDVLWLMGEEAPSWAPSHRRELIALCRKLQPKILVNGRFEPMTLPGDRPRVAPDYPGDFESEAWTSSNIGHDRSICLPWQSFWGFREGEPAINSQSILIAITKAAGRDCNLLLNTGPTPEGSLPPKLAEALTEVGAWLDGHGVAIYGTRRGPHGSSSWGAQTWGVHEDGSETLYCILSTPDRDPNGDHLVLAPRNKPRTLRWFGSDKPAQLAYNGWMVRPIDPPEDQEIPILIAEYDGPILVVRSPRIHAPARQFYDELTIRLEPDWPNHVVHYTLDGSDPRPSDPVPKDPFTIRETTTVRATSFVAGQAAGTYQWAFKKVDPLPALELSKDSLKPGFRFRKFSDFNRNATFSGLEADEAGVLETLDLPERWLNKRLGLELEGIFSVPQTDLYQFEITVRQTASIQIGDTRDYLFNGGTASVLGGPRTTRSFHTAVLEEGLHPLVIRYFNFEGDFELDIRWRPVRTEPAEYSPLFDRVQYIEVR